MSRCTRTETERKPRRNVKKKVILFVGESSLSCGWWQRRLARKSAILYTSCSSHFSFAQICSEPEPTLQLHFQSYFGYQLWHKPFATPHHVHKAVRILSKSRSHSSAPFCTQVETCSVTHLFLQLHSAQVWQGLRPGEQNAHWFRCWALTCSPSSSAGMVGAVAKHRLTTIVSSTLLSFLLIFLA